MSQLTTALESLLNAATTGEKPQAEHLMTVLEAPDEHTMTIVAAAAQLRHRYFGNRVKLNYLVNLKSGLCPEDCGYCSQRLGSKADILKYTWLSADQASQQASAGVSGGASRVCLVASGRGPTDKDVERVGETIAAIRDQNPNVEVCACLGLLKPGQADRLSELGADAYNHNLNTSDDKYGEICSTHTYDDRIETVSAARDAGMSPCSGLIAGMGENNAGLVSVALQLRELNADSVPVNFLLPVKGTPLEDTWHLSPLRCLRILAMVRLAHPSTEVRLGAGREVHLRGLQSVALQIVNSIFLGDYLTTEGQGAEKDLQLLRDSGMEPLESTHDADSQSHDELIRPRKRGAGTDLAPNA